MESSAIGWRASLLLLLLASVGILAGCGSTMQPSGGPPAGLPEGTAQPCPVAVSTTIPAPDRPFVLPACVAGRAYLGDIQGTGQPEVGSAIKILRVVVSLDPAPADISLWDANENGEIDPGDAIKILRCVVELDPWPIKDIAPTGNVTVTVE